MNSSMLATRFMGYLDARINKPRVNNVEQKYNTRKNTRSKNRRRHKITMHKPDIDIDRGAVLCVIVIAGIVILAGFIIYGYWYNAANTTIVADGKATKLDTDVWGHWVTIDNNTRWNIEEQAWTTIRIGDHVQVYDIWSQWENVMDHRIAIS
jgi:hypothetical protein